MVPMKCEPTYVPTEAHKMEAYDISAGLDEFSVAREHFDQLVHCLYSDKMAAAEHGDVEQVSKTEGFEILRKLLQGYLNLRTSREPLLEGVKGSDGVLRTHRVEGSTRFLESYFGEVTATRIRYGLPDHKSLFPLDAAALSIVSATYCSCSPCPNVNFPAPIRVGTPAPYTVFTVRSPSPPLPNPACTFRQFF